MTVVYIVMVEDRHIDTEARVFSTAEKAIAHARQIMEDERSSGLHVDPEEASMSADDLKEAGWMFYGCYSVEGDCVWVVEAEIDAHDW